MMKTSICIILLSICLSSRLEATEIKIEDNYIRQNPSKAVKQAMEGIPGWVKEYMAWHSEQRKNNLNDPSTKFLTVACFSNRNCRGVSDRIRPMPYYVLLAYKLQRVLFIKWQKFELENFLLPPPGGLDWRLPEGVDIGEGWNYDIKKEQVYIWNDADEFVTNTKNLVVGYATPDIWFLIKDFKKKYFTTEQRPDGSYSDLMDILFEPSPPVAAVIQATMKNLDLVPKQYAAAHYRAQDRKPSDPVGGRIPDESTKEEINHAISCAVFISNETKVYFTSSQTSYVQYVLRESPFSKSRLLVNVTGTTEFERLHSDNLGARGNWFKSDPSILYPVFVDLWLMKNSKCVAYGMLGFGKLGSRLTGEHCSINFLMHKFCPSFS